MQLSKKGKFIRALVVLTAIPIYMGLRCGGDNKFSVIILLIILIGMPLSIVYYGLKNFRNIIILNILLALSLAVANGIFAYRSNVFIHVLLMFLLLYLLVMFAVDFFGIFWFLFDGYRFLSLLPMLLSVITIILAVQAGKFGHQLRIRFFENHLTEYEQVVQMIENQNHDPNIHISQVEIPNQYKHLAHRVRAKREKQDVLVVDFAWGVSFSRRHTAFEYRSDGSIPDSTHWPFNERINKNWFRVGD